MSNFKERKFWHNFGWRKFLQAAVLTVAVFALLMPKIVFAQLDPGNPAGEAAYNEAQRTPTPAVAPTPSGAGAPSVTRSVIVIDPTTATGTTGAGAASAGTPAATGECPKAGALDLGGKAEQAICELAKKADGGLASKLEDAIKEDGELKQAVDAGNILQDPNSWIRNAWEVARAVVDGAAIVILIFIGLANILHLNIDTYMIKKMLPKAVLAIILANFSLLLLGILNQFVEQLEGLFRGGAWVGITLMAKTWLYWGSGILVAIFLFWLPAVSLPAGLLGCLGATLVLIGIAAFFILWFLHLIQPAVVGLLIVVSPIAFMLMVLPATEGWFRKWLAMLFNWMFMFVVAYFLLSLMGDILPQTKGILTLALEIVVLLFIIRLPFKMGGDIAAGWGKLGTIVGSTAYQGGFARLAHGAKLATVKDPETGKAILKDSSWRNRLKVGMLKNAPFFLPGMGLEALKTRATAEMEMTKGKAETMRGYAWLLGREVAGYRERARKEKEFQEEDVSSEKLQAKIQDFSGRKGWDIKQDQDLEDGANTLASTKKEKRADVVYDQLGRIAKEMMGDDWEDFTDDFETPLYTLRKRAGGSFHSPRARAARAALRVLGFTTIGDQPLGVDENDFAKLMGYRVGGGPSTSVEPSVSEGASVASEHNQFGPLNEEGKEEADFAQDVDDKSAQKDRVGQEDIEALMREHSGLSNPGQFRVMADKLTKSLERLNTTLRQTGIGNEKLISGFNQAVWARSGVDPWRKAGIEPGQSFYWREFNKNLKALDLEDNQERSLLTLVEKPGDISIDDLTSIGGLSPEQARVVWPTLTEYQNSCLIEQGIAVNRGVNDLGNQGVNFNLLGTIARQTQQVVQKQPNPDEWLSQRSAALSRSVADLEKGAMPIESMERARQNLLADISAASPVVKYEDHDRLLMELKSAAHAIEGLRTNSQIREVASQPEGRASTAQLQSLYRERAGDIYREKMQSPMRRT